ncbi:MAG: chorismate mutase [Firmicutes bacterium]|nr:chorismate mutase [Bacillota bacterium]
MRLLGIRGATTATADEREAILSATGELLREIFARNSFEPSAIVSAFFTVTPDLTRAFPAEALRRQGLDWVPALGAVEAEVPGAPRFCIRVMLHVYTDCPLEEINHVYLRGAKSLRPDRVRETD